MEHRKLIYGGAAIFFILLCMVLAARFFAPERVEVVYPEPVATTTLVGTTELVASVKTAIQTGREPVDEALELVRAASVNILCTSDGSPFKPVSGSGVLIDPRGVVLTAAHIGQYFLLRDYPEKGSIDCRIRTGSPASGDHDADLLYVSTHWVTANQQTLAQAEPLGTGESDFALLLLTDAPPLPFVPLSDDTPEIGDRVAIGAYGAEYLDGEAILTRLMQIVDEGVVEKLYTFEKDSADLVSVSGSLAAQQGSSGGAVLNADGELVGLITTSSPDPVLADRRLRAITPTHIRERFEADLGMDLEAYLASAPLPSLVSSFSERARTLRDILIRATGA